MTIGRGLEVDERTVRPHAIVGGAWPWRRNLQPPYGIRVRAIRTFSIATASPHNSTPDNNGL
jgi:hypothetical protein